MDPLYERFKREAAERNRRIIAARKAGMTFDELAKAYDLTRQRISKICEPLRQRKAEMPSKAKAERAA